MPGSKSTAENNLEESKSFAQTPVIQSTNPGQDLLYLDYLNTQNLFESEEEQENSEASDDDYIMNTSLRKDVINKTLFRSVRKQFRNCYMSCISQRRCASTFNTEMNFGNTQ